MTRSQLDLRRTLPLLLGGSLLAVTAAAAVAQSTAGALSSDPVASTPPGGTGVSSAFTGPTALRGPAGASADNGRVFRRPAAKRSRRATATPVQGLIRPTITSPDLAATVQAPQGGLPDPVVAEARPTVRRPAPAIDDPYAPLGLRVGNVVVLPAIGESVGYDSNPNRTQFNRQGSFVSQTEAEVALRSDWSAHELTGQLRGAYNEYTENPSASRPEGSGRVNLRLDVTRDSQIDIGGRFQLDTQRPDSPDLNVGGVRERPVVATEGASLGFTQRFSRLIGTIQGNVDRVDYDDVKLANGGTLDQKDRNLTQYGIRGRLGYEVTPALVPFVEVLADTRDYDRRVDDFGFARSSTGIGGRVGAAFELTRLVKGEIGVGVVNRHYDDPRLRDLVSPLLDASLTWAVTPLTTVKATAQAGVDETTIPYATGVQTVRGGIEVSHDFRRWLNLTVGLTASNYDYQGVPVTETGFGALVRAEYRFTRWLALRASYNYEQIHSTIAGSSYSTNVFLLGMRFTP